MRLLRLAIGLLCALSLGPVRAQELPLLGLARVTISVSDLQKAHAFYHDGLGYEQVFRDTSADGATVLRVVYKVNDEQFIELVPGLTADQVIPMTRIAMRTGDVEKLRQMLLERGVNVGSIATDADGNRCCAIHELPGQRLEALEFVQYFPDSRYSQSIGKALGPRRIATHLEHTGIVVTDYAAAREFYIKKLGCRETWSRSQDNGQPLINHLRLPSTSGDFVELSNKPRSLARAAAGTAAHLALTVPDIKVTYHLALDRGLSKDIKEPRFGKDRRWQFNLFDPDGTRVECMQPPEIPEGE